MVFVNKKYQSFLSLSLHFYSSTESKARFPISKALHFTSVNFVGGCSISISPCMLFLNIYP